jgi:hypothetical protein
MKRYLLIALLVACSLVNTAFHFGFLDPVHAINLTNTPTPSSSPASGMGVNLTIDKIFGIITGIACFLIRISIALIVIALIYYGIRFLTSQGDPVKVSEAKTALGWAIVGILVIFGTYTIIKTVSYAVGAGGDVGRIVCSGSSADSDDDSGDDFPERPEGF